MRHCTYIRCRIRYEHTMSYVMYIRHRMSISDIRHCQQYVEMNTYDVVCVTYDVVCRRTTSYVTYDVARTMYVYILYIARTTSYVRCSTRCRTSHVRCRTCMTYDIVRDVQPVPKAYRKWCVKFRTTTSLRTGLIGVIQHSLSEHLKCLKSKTWNDLTSANLFFLERRMRSAAKRVEPSLGYGYLSKMEWFSLRPQLV